jgi:hypothetical protein
MKIWLYNCMTKVAKTTLGPLGINYHLIIVQSLFDYNVLTIQFQIFPLLSLSIIYSNYNGTYAYW